MGMPERAAATMRGEQPSAVTMVPSVVKSESSAWATFRTCKGTGKGHQIRLSPTEEEDVQIPGEKGSRRVPIQGTGIKVKFKEGVYMTNASKIIEVLLADEGGKFGFGIQYEINTSDPTGYWRERSKTDDRFHVRTREVVDISVDHSGQIGQGALHSRVAKVA